MSAPRPSAQCFSCAHLDGIYTSPPAPDGQEGDSVGICKAFPRPIGGPPVTTTYRTSVVPTTPRAVPPRPGSFVPFTRPTERVGIPAEIWEGRFDHRQAYPGDRGIRWQSNGTPHPAAREEGRP